MKAESRQIPQKLAARLKFVYGIYRFRIAFERWERFTVCVFAWFAQWHALRRQQNKHLLSVEFS